MGWIVVAVLGIAVLSGLVAACVISKPRRPATDATYVRNSYAAAVATSGAAVLTIVAALVVVSL